MKRITGILICLLLAVSLFTGCTTLSLYNDLKSQDGVMDASVEIKDHSVKCKVILDEDAEASQTAALAEESAYKARKVFETRSIEILVIQNNKVLDSFYLE